MMETGFWPGMVQEIWEQVLSRFINYHSNLIIVLCSVDHTYGTEYGNYAHLKTGNMEMGQTASLLGPELNQVNENGDCFQFWYFLHGR